MNIIDLIKNNLSGPALGQLGSLIGASPEQTKAAAGAAVPAILAGMGKSASTKEGADRLTELINGLDPSLSGNPGGTYSSGNAAGMEEQGGNMLDKILGGGMLGSLGGLISKFSGLGLPLIKKLLGLLAPLILGTIAKQMGGKVSSQGLGQFFAEQKSNIANAVPSGLSLSSIPGFDSLGASAQQVADTAKKASPLIWVIAVLLVALGIVLWYYLKPVPSTNLPANSQLGKEVAKTAEVTLTDTINTFFTTATDSLNGIKDAATADAALPKLKELAGKTEEMQKGFNLIPDAGKGAIKTLITGGIAKLKPIIDKLLAMPGVGDKLKPAIEPLMTKLAAIAG